MSFTVALDAVALAHDVLGPTPVLSAIFPLAADLAPVHVQTLVPTVPFVGTSNGQVSRADVEPSGVFCTSRDCGDERDWLTARPSRVVGWVLGALAVLVGVALAVLTCKWCSLPFFDAVLAMAELAVSLFLRAALGMDLGNSDMVYKASMVFSYHAGIQVACLLSVLAIHMHLHFHPEALSRRVLALTVSRVLSVCLAAMVIVGVALMFDERVPFAGTGIRLIQVSMFAIVLACIVLGAAVMRTSKCTAADYYHRHYAAFGTLLFFLALWAAFMGVRTLVPLQSPARDTRHEAVFYILGYGPLLIAGAAMVILKAPLLFNFDLASRWHKR